MILYAFKVWFAKKVYLLGLLRVSVLILLKFCIEGADSGSDSIPKSFGESKGN